jgi:hypothetical protein
MPVPVTLPPRLAMAMAVAIGVGRCALTRRPPAALESCRARRRAGRARRPLSRRPQAPPGVPVAAPSGAACAQCSPSMLAVVAQSGQRKRALLVRGPRAAGPH